MRKNKVVIDPIEHHKRQLEFQLREMREYFCGNPTRFFEVGQRVTFGNWCNVIVTEVLDNGKIYKIKYAKEDSGVYNETYRSWVDLYPIVDNGVLIKDTPMIHIKDEDDVRVSFNQRDLDGLVLTYFHFGIETETPYQRGNVWTPEQRVDLINSIFNNISIGTFVLLHREYKEKEKDYEIVDGKQRLLTIIDFVEDRFTYRGKKFSQLHPGDRSFFDSYNVSWGEVRDMTPLKVYQLFLKLNTCGKPQEQAHIDKVRAMYEEELKKKGN